MPSKSLATSPLSTATEAIYWRRPLRVPGVPQALHVRQWDDEVVLFHAATGATHLLSPEALTVLEMLVQGPCSQQQLGAALTTEYDVDATTLADDIARLLAQLAGFDLIEACAA